MKKSIFICFLGGLCLSGSEISAQSNVVESPTEPHTHKVGASLSELEQRIAPALLDSLAIGDQLPPGIVLENLWDSNPIALDSFAGDYMILQFWAPTCTGSIASLSSVDKLLSKYSGQIDLVPVTTFSRESANQIFESYASLQDLRKPMGVNGDGLRTLFPHATIPHFVVLDPVGKVLAITGVEDITKENLDKLLIEGQADFRLKIDKEIKLDRYERLISQSQQLSNKNIWFQSALTGYIPDVGGSLIQKFEDLSHIRMVNLPLYYLYRLAYSERDLEDYFGKNRIVAIGFDEEELFTDKSGADYRDWQEEGNHVFGYELLAPPSKNPYALMREDLNRFFPNIKAEIQKETRTVYGIVQQEGKEYPKSASLERKYQAGPMGVSMSNYPLQGLVYHLNTYFYQASEHPVVNLTGIDYPIDLQLNTAISDPVEFRQALRSVGLDLVEVEREINVLVLQKLGETKPLVL